MFFHVRKSAGAEWTHWSWSARVQVLAICFYSPKTHNDKCLKVFRCISMNSILQLQTNSWEESCPAVQLHLFFVKKKMLEDSYCFDVTMQSFNNYSELPLHWLLNCANRIGNDKFASWKHNSLKKKQQHFLEKKVSCWRKWFFEAFRKRHVSQNCNGNTLNFSS